MTVDIKDLDAHEQPSDELKARWKAFSKTEQQQLVSSGDIDDLESPETAAEFCVAGTIPAEQINASIRHLYPTDATTPQVEKDATIYFHPLLPGELGTLVVHLVGQIANDTKASS